MEDNAAPDTSNFLDWVEIKNFKSIKDLRLDCKRVNIFIGKPNVGKSNILEALGLLNAGVRNTKKFMNGSIRYESVDQLFYDSTIDSAITVTSDKISNMIGVNLGKMKGSTLPFISQLKLKNIKNSPSRQFEFNQKGKIISSSTDTYSFSESKEFFKRNPDGPVKKYDFINLMKFDNLFSIYLTPPNGDNLYEIINKRKDLWLEFSKLFTEQGLEFILSISDKNFLLQKRIDYRVQQYPYFSIADTFRRFIFYIAAIESNKNSVLVLEEPEVHSFPPYTKTLAHRMASHDENQYFISTHSPYLLQTLISEVDEADLAVYITYYKDYQTRVRLLTSDELQEAQDLSIDLFYNLSRYEPNA